MSCHSSLPQKKKKKVCFSSCTKENVSFWVQNHQSSLSVLKLLWVFLKKTLPLPYIGATSSWGARCEWQQQSFPLPSEVALPFCTVARLPLLSWLSGGWWCGLAVCQGEDLCPLPSRLSLQAVGESLRGSQQSEPGSSKNQWIWAFVLRQEGSAHGRDGG